MADKTPIRTVFDGSGNATGLAEFQTGETVPYEHGGTGLSALGTSGQVLQVNSGADGLEWGTPTQVNLNPYLQVANATATFSTLTQLGNTNSYIASVQSNLDTTNTNVAQKLGGTASVTLTGDVTASGSFSANAISLTTDIAASGTPTGTFGSASKVPIITVGADGRITNISNTNVAGVTGFTYTTANNTFAISTADGGSFTATINEFLDKTGDTMSGALAMGSNKITGLGTPTAGTDATTKTYVDTAVANVVDSAPEALNTLNELAAALGDDANFATTTATTLGTKAANSYVNATFSTLTQLGNTNSYIATKLTASSNLSDLGSASTARTNLGLGSLATLSTVDASTITDNSVGAAELNVTGNGTADQYLASDGDGTMTWKDVPAGYADSDVDAHLSGGTGITYSSGTIAVALSELSTSTTNGDGDYFVVVDTSNAQRKLTKANINISGFNNDAGFTTNVGDITGVTAGSGLTGGGTSGGVTLSHSDTSSQASVNNSGATVIQDVTLDTYGHVTGLASKTMSYTDVGAPSTTGTNASGTWSISITGSAGSASSATSATNATNATNFNVAADNTTNATHYPIFTGGATGNQRPNSDTGLTYNPSSGQLNAAIFNSTSDEKLKENIETITDSLNKVNNLRGVNFNWKKTGDTSMGVIAQEVETVIPEVVSESEEGTKSVNYQAMVGLLIEAIKDQQKQIDELKQIINNV